MLGVIPLFLVSPIAVPPGRDSQTEKNQQEDQELNCCRSAKVPCHEILLFLQLPQLMLKDRLQSVSGLLQPARPEQIVALRLSAVTSQPDSSAFHPLCEPGGKP